MTQSINKSTEHQSILRALPNGRHMATFQELLLMPKATQSCAAGWAWRSEPARLGAIFMELWRLEDKSSPKNAHGGLFL